MSIFIWRHMSIFSENKTAEKRFRSGLEYLIIQYKYKQNIKECKVIEYFKFLGVLLLLNYEFIDWRIFGNANLVTDNLVTDNLVTDNLVTDNLVTANLVTDNLVTENLVTDNLVTTIW